MKTMKRLELRMLDGTGIAIGALLLLIGVFLIDSDAPWTPADVEMYRWAGLILGIVGVHALWVTINDAYKASQDNH